MKIVDTFLFYNELDLLELRLRTHYDKVDRFVIAECDHTFTLNYKGFNLEKHKERFAPWWDKITYLQLTNPPTNSGAWGVERWQRSCFAQGWTDLTDDDVVIISDVDEIIRPEAFDYIRNTDYNFYGLAMPMFYFRFNYMNTNGHYPWRAKAYRGYRGDGEQMRQMDSVPGGTKIELHHAGWHFSWLGDNKAFLEKVRSFSHTELNVPHIVNNVDVATAIAQGRDQLNRPDLHWEPIKFDDYFPEEIRNNIMQYRDLILPGGVKTVQDYWPGGILEERTE